MSAKKLLHSRSSLNGRGGTFNFLSLVRVFVIGLTVIFVASINVFFSSHEVNKRFHSSLTNEEIDGTTNTFTGLSKSRILRSIAGETTKDLVKRARIDIDKYFPEFKKIHSRLEKKKESGMSKTLIFVKIFHYFSKLLK